MGKTRKILCPAPVLPHVFKALERADMLALSQCREEEIRPILPCLVRMSLIAAIENTIESTEARKAILKILSGIEPVNSLVALLSVDFVTLETDIKKEQQLRWEFIYKFYNKFYLIPRYCDIEFECIYLIRYFPLFWIWLMTIHYASCGISKASERLNAHIWAFECIPRTPEKVF